MKKISLFLTIFLLFVNSSFAVSLDEKIGQMLIIGFNGDNVKSRGYKKVLKKVEKGEISGVILFNKNILDKSHLIEMNEKILKANSITPFIAIDNEGGYVQRYDFIKHCSHKTVAGFSEKEAGIHYSTMARLEKELKFNLNFAPVVDLAINKASIIEKKERSFSDDPKIVSKYAKIFINEHNKKKIITSIKHFPGHGSVAGDTHKGFVDATETFREDEIKPYIDLKDFDKLNTVMVSHIFNSNFDSENPASLSKKTIKGLLKDKIGFRGVIVSDDYDMRAIADNYSLRETVVKAINAGVDIMIFSNNIHRYDINVSKKVHKIIKQEIKKGNIKESDIDNSYNKIMALKSQL